MAELSLYLSKGARRYMLCDDLLLYYGYQEI